MKAPFTLPKALSLTNMKTLWLLKCFLLPWRNILVAFYWHCLSNHILTWMFKCQITSWEFSCGEESCLKSYQFQKFLYFHLRSKPRLNPRIWFFVHLFQIVLFPLGRDSYYWDYVREQKCCRIQVTKFFFLSVYFFNWRKVALQCCVGFCHTTMQISHNYTYIHSLLSLPPLFNPPL